MAPVTGRREVINREGTETDGYALIGSRGVVFGCEQAEGQIAACRNVEMASDDATSSIPRRANAQTRNASLGWANQNFSNCPIDSIPHLYTAKQTDRCR